MYFSLHENPGTDAYTIDGELSGSELAKAAEVFTDSIIQSSSVDEPLVAAGFDWALEIGFKPGVTDNLGATAKEALEDGLSRKINAVYSSKRIYLSGRLTRSEADSVCSGLLANQLIQNWRVFPAIGFKSFPLNLPAVKLASSNKVERFDLSALSDVELQKLSEERVLVLSLGEMKAIQRALDRPITDVELECLAQTWSEHCKHKIFNAEIEYEDENGKTETINSLFKTFIRKTTEEIGRKKDWLVSVFVDNAGVIKFNSEWNVAFKVETHNSPSALDPYGGALTGILGVNRDAIGTGIGAKPLFNTDVFCFATPFYKGKLPPRLMHPKRVFEGVRSGVQDGGNKSGIPTVNGSVVFHDCFLGKPLVFCGTGGVMPVSVAGRKTHEKRIAAGNLAVMVGGRVGADGIHGATFSSQELHENSPATAVQIGDPITQKKMLDFLLEARDAGLIEALTDNGAGGLSSSIGELAQLSGGCVIQLDSVPLKYPGLKPWEILVSESQERMTAAVSKENVGAFNKLAAKHGVESTVVGEFTDSGFFEASYNNETVASLEMNFLHNGLPHWKLKAKWRKPEEKKATVAEPADCAAELLALLSSLDVCSKEYVVRQYDHEVQAHTSIKPLTGKANDGPSDAAVLKPFEDSREGLVVSHGICPRYSAFDTFAMAANAFDEAMRNFVSVGGNPDYAAALDNFCWCDSVESPKNPDGRFKLAQLVRANQALYRLTQAYGVPLISGKDSMYNDYKIGGTKISILPTLLVSFVGKTPDVAKSVSMDAKKNGDLVYVIGVTKKELGGSEYYSLKNEEGGVVPSVDENSIAAYRKLHAAIHSGLVSSCHDCSDGGLGVALAEKCIAGRIGMQIDLSKAPKTSDITRMDELLFSESASRFVVTVDAAKKTEFERAMVGVELGLVEQLVETNCKSPA